MAFPFTEIYRNSIRPNFPHFGRQTRGPRLHQISMTFVGGRLVDGEQLHSPLQFGLLEVHHQQSLGRHPQEGLRSIQAEVGGLIE